jgi:hypothetical protein
MVDHVRNLKKNAQPFDKAIDEYWSPEEQWYLLEYLSFEYRVEEVLLEPNYNNPEGYSVKFSMDAEPEKIKTLFPLQIGI